MRGAKTPHGNVTFSPRLEAEIRQLFKYESTLSIWRASQRLRLGYSIVQRALRNHIDFFRYKVQSIQSLISQNFASRLTFVTTMKTKIDRREININTIAFGALKIQMCSFLEAYMHSALQFEQLYLLKV